MPPFVSIILVNYNGKRFNRDCIESLLKQSFGDFEIVFVDNASRDGSLEEVEVGFDPLVRSGKLKIVKSKENTGFSGGNNLGARHASESVRYIWLLNNDTVQEEDALKELVVAMESDERLGIVGSLVLDRGSEDRIHDLFFADRKCGVNNYILETSFRNIRDEELSRGLVYTTGIGGCSLLYRREITERPFPEFYFAYAEDTYFSMYSLLRGYRNAICLKSVVHHFGSGSFGKQISLFKSFHGAKNQLANILILHSGRNIRRLLPIFFLYQAIKILVSSPTIRLRGLFHAIVWIVRNRALIREEKKYLESTRKVSDEEFSQSLSPVIFENIYFVEVPKYQSLIMKALNAICRTYFTLLKIR